MSFRFLYRKVPLEKRICTYYKCNNRIQRNLIPDKNGHLYHLGCLNNAREKMWHCFECNLTFDATEASFFEVENARNDCNTMLLRPQCPNCGNQDLKPVARHHSFPSGALVSCPGGV
jgi:hypothetical protein